MSDLNQNRQQKRIEAEKSEIFGKTEQLKQSTQSERSERREQSPEHGGTFGAAGYESSLGQVVEPETVYGAEAIPREIDSSAASNHTSHSTSPSDHIIQKPGRHDRLQHDQLKSLVDEIVQEAKRDISVHLGLSAHDREPAKTVKPAKSSAIPSDSPSARYESFTLDDLQFDEVSRETTYPERLEQSEEQRLSHEPKEIQHLVQMIHADSHLSRPRAFVHEAHAMEKYEPEGAVPVRFHAYYPVYADMNTAQMDAYFSWRTRIRAGQYVHTSVSYAFVYIYELLNGIGADSDLEIYRKLADFQENYASAEPSIEFYLPQWIQDYVIAHRLKGQPVREQFAGRIQVDNRLDRLAHPSNYTDEQVADALLRMGGYRQDEAQDGTKESDSAGSWRTGTLSTTQPQKARKKKRSLGILSGPLVQKDPQILDRVISQSWQAVQNCTATARSFFDVRIARHLVVPVTLFAHAVYDPDPTETVKLQGDSTVEIDPLCSYRFENGHWYLDYVIPQPDRKAEIRGLLHEVDRISRIVWKLGRPLKPRGYFSVYTQEITSALQKVRQQEQEDEWKKAHPPIKIDLSQLTQIRSDAAGTRDSLLTEEEKQAEAEEAVSDEVPDGIVSRETIPQGTAVEKQQPEPSQLSQSSQPESLDVTSLLLGETSDSDQNDDADSVPDLTEPEQYLLKALVHGDTDWKAGLRQRHAMASLVADSINDKLFDQIGDSVIETDDNGDPRLVEDYVPDVQRIVSELENKNKTA
jgi:hypothetical protein